MCLLITCDTGGWRVPASLAAALAPASLPSGNAADPLGSGEQDRHAYLAARTIAHLSGGDLLANPWRSDLVDVGRSTRHRQLFPPAVRRLAPGTRRSILDEVYHPFRRRVRRRLSEMLLQHPYVVHLSVRTFESRTDAGDWRRGDVGLAYDPARGDELDWCLDLIDEMWEATPELKIRRNYPRRGTQDSLTRTMRRHFDALNYLGIELMLNRAWASRGVSLRDEALIALADAIGAVTSVDVNQAA